VEEWLRNDLLFPVWKQAHAETERLITGISSDAVRGALRALS